MIEKMKVSFLKYEKDKKSFKLPETLGFDVFNLTDLEQTDSKMKELIKNKYDTIIISNQIAGFSEDIIKKYQNNKDIKIVISFEKNSE